MRRLSSLFIPLLLSVFAVSSLAAQTPATPKNPKVIVFGVNGAEWDLLRPLLVRGELPNLQRVIDNGVSAKLKTVGAPNCPKVYSAIETSTTPEEDGITGFTV